MHHVHSLLYKLKRQQDIVETEQITFCTERTYNKLLMVYLWTLFDKSKTCGHLPGGFNFDQGGQLNQIVHLNPGFRLQLLSK